MPVDATHPEHDKWLPEWQKIDDVCAGQEVVKGRREVYLPRISSKQKDKNYQTYLDHAFLLEASGRTVDGLQGLLHRKPPTVDIGSNSPLAPVLENATATGVPFADFAQTVTGEVIKKGRYGALCEGPEVEGGLPFFLGYRAEEIRNWRREIVGGRLTLTLVVLCEQVEVVSEDGFSTDCRTRYRVLLLVPVSEATPEDPNPRRVYVQRIYTQRGAAERDGSGRSVIAWDFSETVPTIRDAPLDFIPFVFFGPKDLTPDVARAPLLPLVNANLEWYQEYADLKHGLRHTLPTPWVTGYKTPDDVNASQELGPGVFLEYSDPATKLGYLEFKGEGLSHIRTNLVDIQSRMAELGAMMLEVDKREAEAAETLRLRQAGRSANLSQISATASRGLTLLLGWAAAFVRQDPKSVSVLLNRDFFDSRLSPEELKALTESWTAGGLTDEAYSHNLEQGEMLPADKDAAAYAKELKAGREEKAKAAREMVRALPDPETTAPDPEAAPPSDDPAAARL